jgi:RNA polymerase sigma-70 factor (ECF subfamily)
VNERPDSDLVAASREGDREAFGILVRRHRKRIFAICLALTGNQEDAEDALQEVFVRGLERLRTLRDGDQFGNWLAQIARNHCRDLLRKRKRRPDVPLAEIAEVPSADTAGRTEDFAGLRRAIDLLSEDHRLPLLLFYYDGRSVRHLAEELGLSEGGACARLYRARAALRALLEEQEVGHA